MFRAPVLVRRIAFGALLSAVSAAQTVVTYQSGVSGGVYALTRSSCVRNTSSLANATVVENEFLELGSSATQSNGHALVDFPRVVGPAVGQIPPGAIVANAQLKLWCVSAGGGAGTARTVTCRPLTDFERRGSWYEPPTNSALTQSSAVGVSWHRRDGRPNANNLWAAASPASPTFVDPALDAQFPGFVTSINVVPNGSGGAFATGQWHVFTVTAAVGLWTQGLSVQGFKVETSSSPVTYASDDDPVASHRPQLVVTYAAPAPGAFVFNRTPRMTDPIPSQPATTQGSDLLIALTAVDDDGPPPELVLLSRPLHGDLLGTPPFVTYRPHPDFVGTDAFDVAARDAFSISYTQTVQLTVVPAAGVVATAYQAGVSPLGPANAGATRSCGIRVSTSSHAAFEEATFKVLALSRAGFLDFPNLIGTGAGQIPPGSRVLSARLELRANAVNGAGTPRTLSAHRIADPLARGTTWVEPATFEPDPAGGDFKGVSWVYPDARTAASSSPPQWWIPGGDAHPFDVATSEISAADQNGVTKTFDVTHAVQAWAAGEPNYGWTLRNSDGTNAVIVDADDAAVPADRPRLVVAYRPPGAAQGAAEPPHADAGPDRRPLAGQTVTLDATGSSHPLNVPLSFIWLQTAGPPVALAPDPHDPPGTPGAFSSRPTFVAPAVPVGATVALDFQLIAGVFGQYSFDAVRVVVTAPPGGGLAAPSPVVDAGADFSLIELTFGGIAASVTGGVGPFQYRWSKLDGPPTTLVGATTSTVTFQAPPVGSANARLLLALEVTDLGAPGYPSVVHDAVSVQVLNAPNAVPVANPGPARSVDAGAWTVLDATASTDADAHPLTFTWTHLAPSNAPQNLSQYVAQGTAAAGKTPWRAPAVAAPTVFQFRLDAFDDEAVGTATLSITVVPPPPAFSGSPDSLAPYRAELTASEARHLLRRMGMGRHPEDVAALVAASRDPNVGLSGFVDAAFAVLPIPDVVDEAMNYAPPIVSPSAGVPFFNQPFDPYPSLTTAQIHAHWITHVFRSPNALLERTVRFVHGRLAASVRNLPGGKRHWCVLHADMFRHGVQTAGTGALVPGTSAFGNWRTVLLHFARDPVTLSFIDGFDNLRFAPNENFAREFFELHALGIFDENGATIYGENDVKESARALTGWRPVCYALDPANPPSCEPAFAAAFHDNGSKIVLGSAPTNFDDQGIVDRALDYDGGDNAARRLARGLLEHFVTAAPSPALTAQTAAVILANNWELAPVLAAVLKSEAMFSAPARKSIAKSPIDLALDAAKLLRTPLQTNDLFGTSSIYNQLRTMASFLGDPVDVNGFPQDLDWADAFSAVRRSELLRRIVLQSRTPSAPVAAALGVFPDFPGIASTPVALDPFLPPPFARRSDETLRLLCEIFDVDLRETAGAGAAASEFDLAKTLLDTMPIGAFATCPAGAPFDGDCVAHRVRIWSMFLLLMEHPEFSSL